MNCRKIFQMIVLCCLGTGLLNAQSVVCGTVADAVSGEVLVAATVFDTLSNKGTLTNEYGFYSLKATRRSCVLACSYVGYEPYFQKLDVSSDTVIIIKLTSSSELGEVTVTSASRERELLSSQMSSHNINRLQVQKIPALFGEVDMVKALQYLPGVSSGMEGTSGIYVRGGGADQNLILLDGIPVYNVNHLFGFFSVFNGDALNSATIYKGGFPARYSGRLSSVIDVRMKEGNMLEFHGAFSLGLLSSKFMLEGPIVKDKTSFLISARRSYVDILSYPFQLLRNSGSSDWKVLLGFYFHDYNLKLNHKFSDRSRLYLGSYLGKDAFYVKDFTEDVHPDTQEKFKRKMSTGFNWGNVTSSLRWNYIWTEQLFSDLTLSYSTYRFTNFDTMEDLFPLSQYGGMEFPEGRTLGKYSIAENYYSGIKDLSLRANFSYVPSDKHYIRFGFEGTGFMFEPGIQLDEFDYEFIGEYTRTQGTDTVRARRYSVYVEDDFKIGNKLKANVGVNANTFLVDGMTYYSLEPRVSARYLVSKQWVLKSSVSRMSQNVHLLTNSTIGLPTDIWVPTTQNLAPEQSWQVALGTKYKSSTNPYEFSCEAFYKRMDNLIEYADGAELLIMDKNWENSIEIGRGIAYGIELFAEKTSGTLTGSVAYTWSKNTRYFDAINNGEPFPFKYDRRHDLSLVANYKINERVSMGAVWVFGSGVRTTIQDYTYVSPMEILGNPDLEDVTFDDNTEFISGFEERNGYQFPAYHRLDVGFNFDKQKKRVKRTWSVGAYNVYNRKNVFFIYSDESGSPPDYVLEKHVFSVSMFPIMPYFRYSISF